MSVSKNPFTPLPRYEAATSYEAVAQAKAPLQLRPERAKINDGNPLKKSNCCEFAWCLGMLNEQLWFIIQLNAECLMN